MKCPCNPSVLFEYCCEPVMLNDSANSPEQLMRSRYSAFATNETDYIYNTFSAPNRTENLKSELAHPSDQIWLSLAIVEATDQNVEFKAYFRDLADKIYVLHERSNFIVEQFKWRYDNGEIIQSGLVSLSRNALCFCGSTKKYKRCCMR